MNRLESHSVKQTLRYSQLLGRLIESKACIALTGTLGAGKTAFVKGLAIGIGIHDTIASPTFSILHEHEGPISLLHSDLYRIEATELFHLGLEEVFENFDGVVVVEWADKFPDILPLDRITINMSSVQSSRIWEMSATGSTSDEILCRWLEEIGSE